MIELIGLAGGAGVGKDTLAARYFRAYGYLSAALADEIKVRVVASGRATFEEVFVTKPPHIRQLLQEEGTERGRDLYGEDYWCNVLEAKLRVNAYRWGDLRRYVCTDVRFPNEVAWVRRLGGRVFKIDAPTRYASNGMTDEARRHRSERALDGYDEYDETIRNDPADVDTVEAQVRRLMRKPGYSEVELFTDPYARRRAS